MHPTGPDSRFELFFCPRYGSIIDGTSYTLFVVEGGEPVPWTKPADLPYDPKKPVPRLGGLFDGDFNGLFCDGSVHLIPRTAPERLVRALITPAGQEPVDMSHIGLPDPRRQAAAHPEPPLVRGQKGSVTARVTYRGEPLAGGVITFHTAEPGDWQTQIGADGRYSVTDVPVGYANITVRTNKAAIPERLGNVMTSTLGCQVKPGKQTHDIDLEP
jgi:hypothetical protein